MAEYSGARRPFLFLLPSLFLLLLLPDETSTALCPDGQYLHARLQACRNCTECAGDLVVLRPCEVHRDTRCGQIGDLLRAVAGNKHRHHHEVHEGHHQRMNQDGDIQWLYGEDVKVAETAEGHQTLPSALEVKSNQEPPFSRAETIVWDWQAIALTSAIFACVLFFLVITLYSLHQAKQWRRLKENFEADVEELSARLSLMAAASAAEKGDFMDPVLEHDSTPTNDGNYLNSKCVYLEHLLSVRKEDQKTGTIPRGNVYIEENKSKT